MANTYSPRTGAVEAPGSRLYWFQSKSKASLDWKRSYLKTKSNKSKGMEEK